MKKFEYGSKKIAFKDMNEFAKELEAIECTRILHIADCMPVQTDDKSHREVYYEIEITN